MKGLLIAFATLLQVSAYSQPLVFTDETTDVTFETRHLLGDLQGVVRSVTGSANIDTGNLAASYLNLALYSSTFQHDDIFVGPDFTKAACFDVKKNPTIDLRSGSITKLKGLNQFQFKGALIVKGKSREITFPFTAVPNVGGYDFSFEFPLARKPYQLHCGFCKKMMFTVKAYGKRQQS